MKQLTSLHTLISLFHTLEEHLHNHDLELALSTVRSILACDEKNYYARAIERRILRVLYVQQEAFEISDSSEYYLDMIIVALIHVCQMAVRFLTDLSRESSSYFKLPINWSDEAKTFP